MELELIESPDMLDVSPKTETGLTVQAAREVAAAAPVQGPLAGALAFLSNGGNAEQLERMLALQERWEANEARKAYAQAMAEFKKVAVVITKDKHVSFKTEKGVTEYNHATLGNVVQTAITALAEFGFSHEWKPSREADRVRVTCKLTHKQGHSEEVTLEAPLDTSGGKNNIQAMGSSVSYLERYTLLAITGLATKEQDDDGAATEAPAIPPELLQAARDAAMKGWKAFAAWIKDRTEAEKLALDPESENLKRAAKAADREAAK